MSEDSAASAPEEPRLHYATRVARIAPTLVSLNSFARLLDLSPEDWLDNREPVWSIAEQIVHWCFVGFRGGTVPRLREQLEAIEKLSPEARP